VLLVDTSVWVEVFRKNSQLVLTDTVDMDEIVTCLPVLQEVLQGFRHESAFRTAREAMLALPIVESPIALDVFEDAVNLYRSARRRGLTVRSSTDCLVAACAVRNDLAVLHHNRDYALLAQISSLREREILP
jgi:predicted nucleic acid-binding protein